MVYEHWKPGSRSKTCVYSATILAILIESHVLTDEREIQGEWMQAECEWSRVTAKIRKIAKET
jgi:hypothetical protein